MSLYSDLRRLQRSDVSRLVKSRLGEFRDVGKRGDREWFSELCFCILTANSKADTALSIQRKLGCSGFLNMPRSKLTKSIRESRHRFHNIKAGYIVCARKSKSIKKILDKESDPRRWLAMNVKGLGWKEASHFLRNVGYTDYAILDRHILNLMKENRLIGKIPVLIEKNYLKIEAKLRSLAKRLKMSLAELDLYMWYMKTGRVLK